MIHADCIVSRYNQMLRDRGTIVALATDFNPGSSMTESLFFVKQLAVFTLKMSVEESINAITAKTSYALARDEEVGSLEVGKKMELNGKNIPREGY